MNEEELTMLSEEDGREEISASELMRPEAGRAAARNVDEAEWDGGWQEDAETDEGEAEDGGRNGGEQDGDERGDGRPGDGRPGDGRPGDGEPRDGRTGDDAESQDAARAAVGRYRDALARLLDDGWTMDELRTMCADDGVRRALEQGETLGRAATAYMRRGTQARKPVKRGVPTFRTAATEDMREDDPIARMTDAEFAAFSRRAKEAALAGKRIRLG